MLIKIFGYICLVILGISISSFFHFIEYTKRPFLIIDQNGNINDKDINKIRSKLNPEFYKTFDVNIPFIIRRIKYGLQYEPDNLYLKTILIYDTPVNVVYIKNTNSSIIKEKSE